MRVAIYSPLPPEKTGIGDYSFELLEALNPLVDLTAVVDDLQLETAVVPEGVSLAGASQVDADSFDCAIYQMGNNSKFHRFVYAQALEVPGLLVMHDPSLADFHAEICGNHENPVFEEEVRFDSPDLDPFDLPRVDIGRGLQDVDRLGVLLGRRLISASTRILVNSGGMASVLGARYPAADIRTIRLPAQIVFPESTYALLHSPDEVRIGVFGGINYYKRVRSALEAFLLLRSEFPGARLVVAGRADDKLLEVELRRFASQPAFGGAVEFETELSLHDLEQEMARCDVAVQLRWPTAGEMSATLMRTFGAGRPAVVTDVPQFSDLDPTFCWRVSPDPAREVEELHAIMRRVAGEPDGARRAGEAARAFVEREATYDIVAKAYVEHAAECAEINKTRPRRRSTQLNAVRNGVNLVVAAGSRTEVLEAVRRLQHSLRHAGVPSDLVAVEMPYAEIPTATQRLRPTAWGAWPPQTRREALEWVDHWTAQRGPHATDLLVLDDRFTSRFTEYAHTAHQRGRTVIGFVAPEAEPMAQHFLALLAELDEVWTTSHFGAQVLQGHIDRPVLVVALKGADLVTNEAAAAADAPMRVLTVVDLSGSLVRANLIGTLRAFQRAFPESDSGNRAVLTVALVGTAIDTDPDVNADARDRALSFGATVVDVGQHELPNLIRECDVYLASHHSDPYGLALFDALSAGRPIVAPSQIGPLDTLPMSTYLSAGGNLTVLNRGEFPREPQAVRRFAEWQRWASFDERRAAEALKRLAQDSRLRADLGERSRKAWSGIFGSLTFGREIAEHIMELRDAELETVSKASHWYRSGDLRERDRSTAQRAIIRGFLERSGIEN